MKLGFNTTRTDDRNKAEYTLSQRKHFTAIVMAFLHELKGNIAVRVSYSKAAMRR